MRVWLPYPSSEFTALPAELAVDVYDGTGDPPGNGDEVEFYVQPYLGPPRTLAVLAELPKLRVVQVLTAGVDNVLPHLPDGVTLCNAKGVHDASTAELTVGLMVASLRGLPDFVRAQEEGRWAFRFTESLADKTVLLVGYGAVGAAVERRLAAFECRQVLRAARNPRPGVAGLAELPALLPQADVVVLIVPMTPQTHHLVDASFLARMRDGALLVNVARGPVVDTLALVAELESGRLRAALDVTDPEPLPSDHPLWRAPGVLISPHVGGASSAFRPRALRLIQDQLRRYVAGEPLLNVITAAY